MPPRVERVDVRRSQARVAVTTQMVGAQRVDGNEDDRRRSGRSRRHWPRPCRRRRRRPCQQDGQEENSREWRASRQAHIRMILDPRHRRKVEQWTLTTRGEQGVGNAHGGEDCCRGRGRARCVRRPGWRRPRRRRHPSGGARSSVGACRGCARIHRRASLRSASNEPRDAALAKDPALRRRRSLARRICARRR